MVGVVAFVTDCAYALFEGVMVGAVYGLVGGVAVFVWEEYFRRRRIA